MRVKSDLSIFFISRDLSMRPTALLATTAVVIFSLSTSVGLATAPANPPQTSSSSIAAHFAAARSAYSGESARDVVAFVEWLLQDSGWQVDDPARHEPRPLAAADVCILFRRYMSWGNDMTRPYTRGFEARGGFRVEPQFDPALPDEAQEATVFLEVEPLAAALHARALDGD